MISPRYIHRLLFSGLCLLALSACGTMQNRPVADAVPADTAQPTAANAKDAGATAEQDNAHDPLEGFNRAMYTFNDKLDKYVLKPVAKGYHAVAPTPVRRSVANFFSNLHDPAVMLNNLLQGKPGQAASDLGRFMVNSTIGIFGLFDVSSKFGLPKHDEDFGQTLAVWGVGDGPYLVLPFFGPSNMRDAPALVVDWETYPLNHPQPIIRKTAARVTSCGCWRLSTSAPSCWMPAISSSRPRARTRTFLCARPTVSTAAT